MSLEEEVRATLTASVVGRRQAFALPGLSGHRRTGGGTVAEDVAAASVAALTVPAGRTAA